MILFDNQTLDQERALYGTRDAHVKNCRFSGPADGESAVKQCRDVRLEGCLMNLRYPFWNDERLVISNCELTSSCRAAIWYTNDVDVLKTKLHGIKAFRECSRIRIIDSDIDSHEFGWFCSDVRLERTRAKSEYMFLHSKRLMVNDALIQAKYAFQYVEDGVFDNLSLETKDGFWHARNIVVRNSVLNGEYLAWYSENATFENCTIVSTQPFCHCRNLRLINCRMLEADRAFEKSQVYAQVTTPVISIKNPSEGYISVPSAGEIIRDEPDSKAVIVETERQSAPEA